MANLFTSTGSPFSAPHFDARAEERFQAWLCKKQLPLALGVLVFLMVTVLVFGAWDKFIAPDDVARIWPIRAGAILFLAGSFGLLRFTGLASHWRLLTLVVNCVLFVLLLLILVQLPDGPLLGAGGLMLSALLFRVHSARLALACGAFNCLAVAVIYHVFHIPARITTNTEVFLVIACAGNVLLNFSENRGDRNLFALEEQLLRQATTDGLTGASNRRFFSGRLDEEVARASRYGQQLTLVLLDIDRFKSVNDSRGHGDGDLALQAVSALGLDTVRGSDVFARLGGEEFVVLLPHADLEAGVGLAERLRSQIEARRIEGESGEFSVSASFGVATLARGENGDTLVARADAALYLAKNSGRNQVQSQTQLQTHARSMDEQSGRSG